MNILSEFRNKPSILRYISIVLIIMVTQQTGFAAVGTTSSLLAAPPSSDLGKNSSPAFTEDQVNSTGGFSYAYPLTFPVGRHGVNPMVSLNYLSDAPLRDGLAAGWSLSIPLIKGDTSKGTLDPSGNNPAQSHFISSFMGGGPLIRQSNSPVDQGDIEVYYTLHDNQYIRYEFNKSPLNEPYWRVRTPDGHIYMNLVIPHGISHTSHRCIGKPTPSVMSSSIDGIEKPSQLWAK